MPTFWPTETEQNIFNLLLDVVKVESPSTILRLAGGIVRDRLLGIESSDIDIAIDNMTGEKFCELIAKYLKDRSFDGAKFSVVKANPDQSKHLETAMMKIHGINIDFVNLRKETYSDSRIPIMEIGTAKEDAERRDLTINALFYNINTGEIEDFVGGLIDLELGIAKTPIDPIQTFIDDPLRILRVIRFAAKFDLKVDKEIIYACHDERVREALKTKVSPERIFKELGGHLLGDDKWKSGCFSIDHPSSANALELIEKMGIRYLIFENCNINFHKSFYYLNNVQTFGYAQDILVLTLAVILRENSSSQINEALLKIKCPKNIIAKIINLNECVRFVRFNLISDRNIREFLRKIKDDYNLAIHLFEIDYMGHIDFSIISSKIYLNIEKYGWEIRSPISGKDLLNYGFVAGKKLGKALNALDNELLNNPEISFEEALEFCKNFK